MDQLTPARVTSKLKKFGLGKDGVKSKKSKTDTKEDKNAKQKEDEGKLMVDEED
jgi:hypothetical protein